MKIEMKRHCSLFCRYSNGVTAHRGDSSCAPENTLTAFRQAIEAGVDWLELDVSTTKDGHLVVIHDETTGRTANADLNVAQSTLSELRELDMACAFRRLSARPVLREKIPLLEEVLDLVLEQERCRVSINPKDCDINSVMDVLERRDVLEWSGINSQEFSHLEAARKRDDDIVLFWDRPANFKIDLDVKKAEKISVSTIVIEYSGITRLKTSTLQNSGFKVGVWTVNDLDIMREMLFFGVDRIYTNFPSKLLKLQGIDFIKPKIHLNRKFNRLNRTFSGL